MKKTTLIGVIMFAISCEQQSSVEQIPLLDTKRFETVIGNKQVELFTIKGCGITTQITNYGARVVSLFVKDREGQYQDVVWGYESIEEYLNCSDHNSGPIVGRYGNRIGKGKFSLGGKEYQLSINDGENHLHGGTNGFASQIWDGKQLNDSTVVMSYTSVDGEEGYPGEVKISVKYTATHDAALRLEYVATTDAKTIINPTSHCYFNLDGRANSILNHVLEIKADQYTPTDNGLIPTGEIVSVANTPLDFRTPTPIGKRINESYEALIFGKGYDHNWIFTNQGLEHAQVVIYSPNSGIEMSMYTDQPATQFYSGNFMTGADTGKYGDKNNYRTGVAIEAQNYPDAPNHSNFPSSVLNPNDKYKQTTTYKFKHR